MDLSTAATAAEPDGAGLGSGHIGAAQVRVAASTTAATLARPTANAVERQFATGASADASRIIAASSAISAAAVVTKATTAGAAEVEGARTAQGKTVKLDCDTANASAVSSAPPATSPPAPSALDPLPAGKRNKTLVVQGAKTSTLAAQAEPETCAETSNGSSNALSTASSAPDVGESRENTAAAVSDAPRITVSRQRRSAGRPRVSLSTVGKGDAAGGNCENFTASGYSAIPLDAPAAAATTRSGGSSANISKREQEKVKKRYEPLLRETEEALQKIIAQGLPEVDTLTQPQIYLELKKAIFSGTSPPLGEEPTTVGGEEDEGACPGADDDDNSFAFSRVKRLLRALCEGSSLPLSQLVKVVRVVLLDETDGATKEDVSPETLQSVIPVLLARRSLGIPAKRGVAPGAAVSSPICTRAGFPAAEVASETTTSPASAAVAKVGEATTTTGEAVAAAASAFPLSKPGSDHPCYLYSSPVKDNPEGAARRSPAAASIPTEAPAADDSGLASLFLGNGRGFDRNEDTTRSRLWVWESAFLEGLPPTFKETAKKNREKRAAVSRRVRSLLRLQQAIEQGNEKEILVAQEKVAVLERKQQQEEERRREQQLKKRRAEEARLEKEREKKQKEDAKREKEKKRLEEQQRQAQQQGAGGGGGAGRVQASVPGKAEKPGAAQKLERKKELPSSTLNQQLLMASWLTRKPLFFFFEKSPQHAPTGGECYRNSRSCHETASNFNPGTRSGALSALASNVRDMKDCLEGGRLINSGVGRRQPIGGTNAAFVRLAGASCFPWEKARRGVSSAEEIAFEVEQEKEAGSREELMHRKAEEVARARAAAEAALWRVPEDKRPQFVDQVLSLPKALVPLPSSSNTHIPFFDGVNDFEYRWGSSDAENYMKAFIDSCAAPHRKAWKKFYSFFAINRQYICRFPTGSGGIQAQQSSAGSSGEGNAYTYCQDVRQVRKGLSLTDYVHNSLPDLEYLRTVLINLDEWKRPVRRLLLGKCAKRSIAWRQWTEETCIDYDCDSDEEWFENFDVDDLDDARDEEEEDDQEADEDKDWLVDDDDDGGGFKSGSTSLGHGVRFESLCDWHWTFEGEERPNHNDGAAKAHVTRTLAH